MLESLPKLSRGVGVAIGYMCGSNVKLKFDGPKKGREALCLGHSGLNDIIFRVWRLGSWEFLACYDLRVS